MVGVEMLSRMIERTRHMARKRLLGVADGAAIRGFAEAKMRDTIEPSNLHPL